MTYTERLLKDCTLCPGDAMQTGSGENGVPAA